MLSVALFAFLESSALAAALEPSMSLHLLRQRDTCGGSDNFFQCGFGLPNGFCCATGTVCLPLNNTATAAAICCPAGKDCTQIQPITCDTSQQDAGRHPTLPFHMADTSVELQTCGSNCCPLGFSCDGGTTCKIMDSTKAAPSSSSSSSLSSPTSTASSAAAASSTQTTLSTNTSATTTITSSSVAAAALRPTATSDAANSPKQPTSDDGVTGKGFAAGFIPGIILGILATAGILWYLRRRNAQRNRESGETFIGRRQPAPKISEPIYQPQMGMRTDFLNHQRSASADNHPLRGMRPLDSSAIRGRSPASFISAPLGGSFVSFPSEPISQRQQPSSGATLTDESSFRPRIGNDVTPTPAPRRKSLPRNAQYPGTSLSLEDYDSAKSIPRGGTASTPVKVNVRDGRTSPTIKRKRGTPTLGKGNQAKAEVRDSVNTHRRGSSGGETIEISMGLDRPEVGPLRPRQSSYYPPQASDPDFLGSGPRYTVAARHEDEYDPRRQTTYSDVMRAVGARESQLGTPKSPPPMPVLPAVAYNNGQPPKLGSPWKPLRTNKQQGG